MNLPLWLYHYLPCRLFGWIPRSCRYFLPDHYPPPLLRLPPLRSATTISRLPSTPATYHVPDSSTENGMAGQENHTYLA